MRARLHLPRGIKYYSDALEGLSRVNADLYRDNPNLPSIYDAGVRYRGRDPQEDWRNAVEVVNERYGDCEDLAAARVGELRARRGEAAHVDVRRTGPKMTHAFVIRGDGSIEDPSRKLGMGARDQIGGIGMSRYPGYDSMGASFKPMTPIRRIVKQAAIAPKRVINVPAVTLATSMRPIAAATIAAPIVSTPSNAPSEPFERDNSDFELPYSGDPEPYELSDTGMDEYGNEESEGWPMSATDWDGIGADDSDSAELTWKVDRTATGWQGVVRVPLSAGRALFVSRSGDSQKAATKNALTAATGVLDSPLAKTLIPPQALAALNVLRSPTAQKAAKVAFDVAKKLKFW